METRFYKRKVEELLNDSVPETCTSHGKPKKKSKPEEFDETASQDEELGSHSINPNTNSSKTKEIDLNKSASKQESDSGSSSDDDDQSQEDSSSTTDSSSSEEEEEEKPQKKRGRQTKGKSVATSARKADSSKTSDVHSTDKPEQKTDSPKSPENDADMNAEDADSGAAVLENLVKPDRLSDTCAVWKTCLVKITATILESSPAATTTQGQGVIMTRCQHCDLDVDWYKLSRHMYYKHRDMDYTLKCYLCEESFSSYALAKTHVKKFHASEEKAVKSQQEEPRQCPICNKTYTTLQQLNRHTAEIHAERKYKRIKKKASELSEEQREKNREMYRRYRANWTEEQRQKERERDRRRTQKGRGPNMNSAEYRELREYLATNPEPPLKCPHCPLDHFPTKNSLQIHHSIKHQPKEHVCHLCGKTMSKKHGLQAHIDAVHGTDRPFICDQCGAAFKRGTHLTMHQTTVHDPEGRKRYQEYTNKMRAFKKKRDMSVQEEEY